MASHSEGSEDTYDPPESELGSERGTNEDNDATYAQQYLQEEEAALAEQTRMDEEMAKSLQEHDQNGNLLNSGEESEEASDDVVEDNLGTPETRAAERARRNGAPPAGGGIAALSHAIRGTEEFRPPEQQDSVKSNLSEMDSPALQGRIHNAMETAVPGGSMGSIGSDLDTPKLQGLIHQGFGVADPYETPTGQDEEMGLMPPPPQREGVPSQCQLTYAAMS